MIVGGGRKWNGVGERCASVVIKETTPGQPNADERGPPARITQLFVRRRESGLAKPPKNSKLATIQNWKRDSS
jgi:hypothetical protein